MRISSNSTSTVKSDNSGAVEGFARYVRSSAVLLFADAIYWRNSFVFIRRAASLWEALRIAKELDQRVSHSENEYPRRCEIMKVRSACAMRVD